MTTTGHTLLAALQDAVARKDEAALRELFDEEAVLFGTGAENLDRAQTEAYLARIVADPDVLRWEWDQVVPLWESSEVLAFAAVGTYRFEDAQGRSDGPREPMRLTCVARRSGDAWRLRHFHGSVAVTG
jgi:hypothetical protein